MKLIDPHIHMTSRTTDDYENMKKAGYVALIEPAFWSGTNKSCVGSHLDYFNHLLNFEHNRAEKYGIRHYSFLGVNAKEAKCKDIAIEVIEELTKSKSYLDHPNCLGIGEIGLDLITSDEEDVFRKQIVLAEENNYLVIIHSPHVNKKFGISKLFKILEEENVDFKRYIMDHNTEDTIDITLSYPDIIAGVTLYPTKVSEERAAKIINQYKNYNNRIILNSSADWGKSYPLNVANAVMLFNSLGIDKDTINKVSFYNSFKFFSQSTKFTLKY